MHRVLTYFAIILSVTVPAGVASLIPSTPLQ
jgi:hypothetical protein